MNILEFINELFGIENETSAPILITLLVFITGGIIGFIYNRIKLYRQRKDLREIFRVMINEIINDCGTKERQTKKFYPTLTTEHREHWSLSFTRINYLNTVFELEFHQVFQAFESFINWSWSDRKLKKEAFHKIYSNLDNIRYFEEFIKPDIEKFIIDFNSHHVKYKDSISNFNEMVDGLRFDLQPTLPLISGRSSIDDYAIETEKIWQKWLAIDEKERVHYKTTYDMLIEPTLTLNRKAFGLHFTLEMNKHLMECKTQIIEMENILKRGHLTFKNHSFNYRSTRRILQKCLEILK